MSQPPPAPLHLTSRDLAMLELVYAYHGCGVQHLHARFWSEETTPSATYRRVSRLVQAQYLIAHRLPSVTGQGSGKTLLSLGHRGRRVLAEHRDISVRSLPRMKLAASALFVQHHFAICDVRVALELAVERTADVRLLQWTAEAVLKRSPMKVQDTHVPAGDAGVKMITLIPDGAFVLSYAGQEQQGFLEMDMGTLAPKRLQQKLRGYLLLQTQLHTPVFFVAPSERRVEQIRRIAEAEAKQLGADPTFFFLSTHAASTSENIPAGAIWHQCGVGSAVAILPDRRVQQPNARSDAPLPAGPAAAPVRRP